MTESVESPKRATPGQTKWPMPRVFRQLLINTLMTGVTSSFLWFALTFWVFLETRSVVATGIIAGAFSLISALLSPWFGTFVDRHRKHLSMTVVTVVAVVCFGLAGVVFVLVEPESLLRLDGPWFWLLVSVTLVGSVAGGLRSIVLSTCVTLLVPEPDHDRANGMVGAVTGVSFAITSVLSGLVVGQLGMVWAYGFALLLTVVGLVHLSTIRFTEPEPDGGFRGGSGSHIDVRGALEAIHAVPGLLMLILLAAFNNLLGGVFMALMDAYGLMLVSVEVWGFLWGFLSLAFIAGGLVVARRGLGPNPVGVLIGANLAIWVVCSLFAVRSSIVALTIGMLVYLALVPAIEAAEQTVLQKTIPYERQGRVFGFAQMVENAAAPITAFLIAPLAETFFMPFMTDGGGAEAIGPWFGVGPERGLALVFTIAGIIGIVTTLAVRGSKSYAAISREMMRG